MARCAASWASHTAARSSARRVLPLFWPPKINSLRATRSSGMTIRPVRDDAMQLLHAVRECRRTGLQDVGGFDLEQLLLVDGGHRVPTRPRGDLLGPELLAAPGADHDVGVAADDLGVIRDDPVLAQGLA